ncbi:MAG: hypothetical protein DRP45_05285 [Candidatus Zixiibacteriota bacterium]|nr:MAG: hypothetical protein DRP45_05285 [candidate division Zixibacteria bacterium]
MRQLILLFVLLLAFSTGQATTSDATLQQQVQVTQEPTQPSALEFVTPDGRFDLESMRQSGFNGTLDLVGLDVQHDPVASEPLVRFLNEDAPKEHPDDIYWSPLGSGMGGAMPVVCALTAYDGKLIVGGGFSTAGGVPANSIASWDGSSWSSIGGLGGSVAWPVLACAVYEDRLIVGGSFWSAGGVETNSIASWDGNNWFPLGSGMGDEPTIPAPAVQTLTVYDGKLIAGGDFTTAGGLVTDYIASWDGNSWSPLGSGMSSGVEALTLYDGKLIAGGYFTTAGGVVADYIASWNGSSWSPLGSGMNNSVRCLTVYNGKLIVGGAFTTAGGMVANYIVSWDGSSWFPLGSGMNYHVYDLTVYDGSLMAGGGFTIVGSVEANYVVAWTKGDTCCIPPSVGDLDQGGGDLGFNYDGADLSLLINGLFIDPLNGWDGICLDEADVDFSSERPVVDPLTVDGADLSELIDALFIAPTHYLKNCDGTDNW